ncbi:hypothetical protein [Vibrio metoecus]|uniref:hypothetical protein n=1 Tax=Vibrio metoecus TaxID=1481663 RepID=UPI0027DBE457|nr:hypothetical protein [Vibrio metoecus]
MYNSPFHFISLAIAGISLVGVHAQAAQNLSSMMVEIRQQDGIPSYYNLATGMPLNGDIAIVRDNQGYTLGSIFAGDTKWKMAGFFIVITAELPKEAINWVTKMALGDCST